MFSASSRKAGERQMAEKWTSPQPPRERLHKKRHNGGLPLSRGAVRSCAFSQQVSILPTKAAHGIRVGPFLAGYKPAGTHDSILAHDSFRGQNHPLGPNRSSSFVRNSASALDLKVSLVFLRTSIAFTMACR
jgi:hypothetical protein